MSAFIEVLIETEPYYDEAEYLSLQIICLGFMICVPVLFFIYSGMNFLSQYCEEKFWEKGNSRKGEEKVEETYDKIESI